MIDLLGMVRCSRRGGSATVMFRACLLSRKRAVKGRPTADSSMEVLSAADPLEDCRGCDEGNGRWLRLVKDRAAMAAFEEFAASSEARFRKAVADHRAWEKAEQKQKFRERMAIARAAKARHQANLKASVGVTGARVTQDPSKGGALAGPSAPAPGTGLDGSTEAAASNASGGEPLGAASRCREDGMKKSAEKEIKGKSGTARGECPICGRVIEGRGMGPHLAACRRREERDAAQLREMMLPPNCPTARPMTEVYRVEMDPTATASNLLREAGVLVSAAKTRGATTQELLEHARRVIVDAGDPAVERQL